MTQHSTRDDGCVFVIDDDVEMCRSMVWLLETVGLTVQAFQSGEEFLDANLFDRPGCLVLDVKMPGQSGLELYEQLLRDGHRWPVIFMTAHADVPTAVQAMKTGAVEFLEKPFDRKSLLELLFKALELDRHWRQKSTRQEEIERRIASLSPREKETLDMLITGDANKVMAARLGITERAVEMRRASIMKKLNVTSLAELLEQVITHRVLAEVRQAAAQRPFLNE